MTTTTHKDEWAEAQEVQSNWFKFVKVGDKIKGTLINKRYQKSNVAGYPDQWVYEIKDANGEVQNVGISVSKPGTIQRLNACKAGDIIGILFEKEGEKKKGFFPAKFLKVVKFGVDPDFSLDAAAVDADHAEGYDEDGLPSM